MWKFDWDYPPQTVNCLAEVLLLDFCVDLCGLKIFVPQQLCSVRQRGTLHLQMSCE